MGTEDDNSDMAGKITFYLVRHAQTSGNVGLKIMDSNEDILTGLGTIQRNLLGMHLSTVKFDYAFSSDFGRAVKTAEGILEFSKASSEIPLETTDHLRETNFGILETTSYKESLAYCRSLNLPIFQWSFPEGESFPESGQRVLKFIEETCTNLFPKLGSQYSPTVLIVGHSASIVFFLHALCNTTTHKVIGLEEKDLKIMKNTCYLKFEVETDGLQEPATIGTPFTFTFLEKYYSKHLDCIKDNTTDVDANPLLNFAKGSSDGKDFVSCIQQ